MNAVLVIVEPDRVADGGYLVDAHIPGGVVFIRVKGGDNGAPVGGVGVAVNGVVSALVLRADGVSGRRNELDKVVAGDEVGELVVAAAVGGGCCYRVTGAVIQVDGYGVYAAFARVLYAVAVGIVPNRVANGGQGLAAVDAHIPGGVVFIRVKGGDNGAPVGGVGVAVNGVIRSLVLRADGVSGGQDKFDKVIAGVEVGELVVAAAVGGGG